VTPAQTLFLSHPALRRRSALRERRPHAIRRHTGRVATRFAVLLTGDVIGIILARIIALTLAAETTFGAVSLDGTPLVEGGRRFIVVAVLVVVAIFAAGGHSRHRALFQPIRLFGAVAGIVVLSWAGGIARGFLSDLILPMVVTTALIWLPVLFVRQLSEWFLQNVWPAQRGAAGAILVGAPSKSERFARAVAAPGGDYRVAGYVSTGDERGDFLGTLEELPALIAAHDAEAVVICADLPVTRISAVIEECLHSGSQILYPARAVRVYGVRPNLVWHYD